MEEGGVGVGEEDAGCVKEPLVWEKAPPGVGEEDATVGKGAATGHGGSRQRTRRRGAGHCRSWRERATHTMKGARGEGAREATELADDDKRIGGFF